MNKKLLLLPIIGSFMLSGCKFNLFGKTIYLFEKPKESEPEVIPDDPPTDTHQHATKLSYSDGSPSAPFFLKVGEVKNIGVTLSPSPDLDEEKTVRWSIDKSEYVKYTIDSTDTKKVTIEGLKPGQSVLTATNDYNQTLTYSFTIKVMEFDEDNDYLWQYDSSDREQFGYVNVEGKKAGTAEGDAVLNGISWHYTRNKTTSLQSSMGAIGFGKGEEPETALHFEYDNIRTVEKLQIEAASANSLAKMTVKVGETTFIDNETVKSDYYDVIGTIYSKEGVLPSKGKVTIDVTTPEYDPQAAATEGYKKPGAFYLKSILINFADEETAATEKTYDFKALYADTDSVFYKSIPTGEDKSMTYADESFRFKFDVIQKATSSVPGYAAVKGDITITPLKAGEVFYKIEAKFNYGTLSSKASFTIEKSKTGGLTYFSTGVSTNKDTGEQKIAFFEDHFNSIRLKQSGTSNTGLESIKVLTLSGNPWTVKNIVAPEQFTPTKTQYYVGETFSTEGLPNLSINFNEENSRPEALAPSALTWYDGASYDAATDKTKASTALQMGTTKVYGVFNGEVIVTINGISVLNDTSSITLVKDASELNTTGHYYIIARSAKKLIRSSYGSDMGTTAGSAVLSEAGEDIALLNAYKNDYYTLEITGGKIAFKATTEHYFGMTKSGNLSRSKSPDQKDATVTINAETFVVTIKYEYGEGDAYKVGYLALGTSVIGMQTTETANLSIYKVVA